MRRQSRELNIFSMSFLDLFASSLGAFILITIILMPFYLRQASTDEQVPVECPVSVPAPACPVCPDCPVCPVSVPAPTCPVCPDCPDTQIETVDNLLVVQMYWIKRGDIDLHVHTPDGEFFHGRKRIQGSRGVFVLDNIPGGANSVEIWKVHRPTPGRYKVCTRYFPVQVDRGEITVRLLLDKPTGPVTPPVQTLEIREKKCPLEFEIDQEYTYTQITP